MFAPDASWIDALAKTTREALHESRAKPNVCIEAARIAVDAAAAFGFVAEPVPVTGHVHAGDQVTIMPGPGRRTYGSDGYAGHLVVYFAGGAVIDLTADQFHAPRRGIYVPDVIRILDVPREALTEGIEFDLPGGTVVGYRELVGDVHWKQLEAWTSSGLIARGVTYTMRKNMNAVR